ncbi:IS630 family transposase [Limobrevibacterium gyesilva]|uniref:IS630 family transposase n=1 Tax=Limobrevibacterium gyesilva TaxID=2991712 RepID=A0AA42CEB0_9PROT|nr:IS630 family transposase [Limobrevibacterium gyesilva]MCW3473281.1 IS630 family transposase [Limobrevibacterium gyesilva]
MVNPDSAGFRLIAVASTRRGGIRCGDGWIGVERPGSRIFSDDDASAAEQRGASPDERAVLLDDGWPAECIAEALFIEAETVREHRRLYATQGRAGIEHLACTGSVPALTAEQCGRVEAELCARLYMSAKEVCDFVAQRFGVDYTPHAMAKLLGRLGFIWKRPKRVPAKADAAAQQAFLEQTLAPLMAQAAANPDQPLYFVDATHPAYDAHPACGWIRKGETRVLKSNHGRANVTLNGALSWPAREVVHRAASKITAAEMIALFQDLQARHPTAIAVNVIVDNATYNRAAAVREWLAGADCRVRLVYLQPYAPNLNLIERLW